MNPNAKNDWSGGRLENAAKSVESNATDCSGWESDIPNDQWSVGKLVGVAQSIPPVVVDCSHWDTGSAAWLELLVSFDESTQPARAIDQTNRLIVASSRVAPELGLFYDAGRSRVEQDNVVIALSPTRAGDAEKRLNEVAAVLQRETTGLRQFMATVMRGRAA